MDKMDDRASILRDMNICRFCLTENESLKNIYSKDKNNAVPLPLQIMACVALEVFANDGMPQLICENCCVQTQQSYNFKTLCKRSDDALKLFLATGVLKRGDTEIPITPKRTHTKENVETPAKRRRTSEKSESDSPKEVTPKKEVIKVSTEEHEVVLKSTPEKPPEIQIQVAEEEIPLHEEGEGVEINEGSINDYSNETQLLFEEEGIEIQQPKVLQTHCYPCNYCERSFPLQQLLEIHMRNHTRERKFSCKKCDKRFFSKHDLNKHLLTHSASKPFTCVVCDKSFSRITLLHRHEKIHVAVPKYLCTYCDRTFLTSESLDSHMKDHKKNRPFQCTKCDKKFAFKQGLERHETSHINEHQFKCNYCTESFSTSSKLQRHITSHAGNRPYPCKLCPRTFVLSHHLTRHMKSHFQAKKTEGEIGDFKCDVCSMSFKKKYLLINHSAIHSMVNLKCVICNKQFEDAQTVKEHITTHLGGFPFECYRCEYSFENEDDLLEHEQKHDDEDEPTLNESNEGPRRSLREKRVKNFTDFLKPEELSDSDLEEDLSENSDEDYTKEQFQPVIRNDSLKTYKGKEKLLQKLDPNKAKNLKITTLENLGISQSTLDSMNLDKSNFVEMKIGQKIIRVQKLRMTKAEVDAISEQGKLDLKGCKVLVKNSPGNIDLNKLTKIASKVALPDELVFNKNVKTYVKKTKNESEADMENVASENVEGAESSQEDVKSTNLIEEKSE